MSIKYALRTPQSLTLVTRKIAHKRKDANGQDIVQYHPPTKIVLTNGSGVITKAEFKSIQDNGTVIAYVEEGLLTFPQDSAMKKIAGTRVKRLRERHDKLSREQHDRKEQGKVERDKDAQIAQLQKDNSDMSSRMDKLEGMLKKAQAAKAPPAAPAAKTIAPAGNSGNA